ncbi:MAG: ArnT family glycosyltransferase [Myxococcota bacterium]
MDDQPNRGRLGALSDAAVERWGVPVTLLIGACVLFAGLGQTGLWDPWEMDRADLGRRLNAPTQVAVGLQAKSPLKDVVAEVAEARHAVPRFADAPRAGARSRPAVQRALRETVERARTSLVAATLLELELLTPEGADTAVWERAYETLRDVHRAVPNGQVLVVSAAAIDEANWERALTVARLRHTWGALSKRYELSEVSWPAAEDPFWDKHLSGGHGLERLTLVTTPEGGDLRASLDAALQLTQGGVVQYKEAGTTYAVPPLHHWLGAAAYATFGASESSARLPSALLAFLAFLIMVWSARGLFGARVATITGLVLATSPIFFVQARSVAGEGGAILGLTLVTVGLLNHVRGASRGMTWSLLGLGLAVGFLAKGLVAPLSYVCIAGVVALVALPTERRGWAPLAALGAVFLLLILWVETSPSYGFAGQFRFTLPIFSEGPTDYERNFDYAMKSIGFGLFPWSPLVVIAMAFAVRIAVREESTTFLVLIAAFVVPTLVSMGFLKDFNHLLWPGAPIAALAVALALERVGEVSERAGTVMAFLVLIMGFILARELGKSAEPLAGLLTYDPPFGEDGGVRFPTEISVKTWARIALLMVVMPFVLHFSRVIEALKPVVAFFRRDTAWVVTVSVFCVLLPLTWVIRVGSAFAVGMDTTTARGLSVGQRGWHAHLLQGGDPVALLALSGLVLVGVSWVLRYAFLWRRFADRGALPSGWRTDKAALLTAGAAFVVLVCHMVWVVWPSGAAAWPEGYWSEVLLSAEALFVLSLSGLACWRLMGRDRLVAWATALAILSLWLGTRLVRDVMFFPPVAIGATAAGGAAWAVYVLPRLWWAPRQGAALGAAIASGALFAWALPLLQRWDHVSEFIYQGQQESLTLYLLLSSRVSWVCYIAIALLIVNRRLPQLFEWLLSRLGGLLERPGLIRAVAVVGALVFSVALLADFYPSLAHHVSQKHVLESYERAANTTQGEGAGVLYKHGRFDESGRQDTNFYTAALPGISDRSTALQVLLGERDQMASIETAEGTSQVFLPGFDSTNDVDGDGLRDQSVISGEATEVSLGALTDDTANWAPDAHAGKVLVGVKGKAYPITGNDATTLRLKTRAKPMLKLRVNDPEHYIIDSAESVEHRASAMRRARQFLLMPSEALSEVNHAFRKLSGGRHLPILDGRSSRVMLAGSWLEEGEAQENRFAQHTLDMARFEALNDPKVHRLWVDFNDTLRIVGYRLESESVAVGKSIELTVYFQVIKKVKASQKIFLHIDRQGTSNRIHGDHWPLNQAVGDEPQKTCVGCYRTDHWFVGDVVTDVFTKEVPTGTTSGIYEIWMGLYNTSTDKRMVVKRWDKEKVRHDGSNRVRLGSFRVR